MCFGKPLAIHTGICYNYFVNCEIINISCRGADGKRTCVVGMETENPSDFCNCGGDDMVVLDVKLDHILIFNDFHINFTYPRKILNSTIENEHLKDRPSFRYKKAVILMGANATGKTSLGVVLSKIFHFINTGNTTLLLDLVAPDAIGSFTIDFVNDGLVLHRLSATIDCESVSLSHGQTTISERDTYEKCAARLDGNCKAVHTHASALRKLFGELRFRFAYPEIDPPFCLVGIDKDMLLHSLKAVLCTLDPFITEIVPSEDLKNSYIIRRPGVDIIIQEGKLLNRELLSSGTAEGVDIAIFMASILSGAGSFYYCDEHFSHIQTDIEKSIFSVMVSKLGENDQLIFTTHNTDMLDLNLPKHSFAFLRKRLEDNDYKVSVMYASDLLKRNTDSIRCAVANDMFLSLPDDSLIYSLEKGITSNDHHLEVQ